MIKAVIIEDEEIAATRLQKLILEVNPNIIIEEVIPSITKAVDFFSSNTIDLIFLDINLLDGNSFEIFNQVEIITPIIFTTAYSEYAIKAFEQNSIDYLLKPITKSALNKSLVKFEAFKKSAVPDYKKILFESKSVFKTRFLVKLNNKLQSVVIEDIAYFYSEDKLTFLTKKDGYKVPINESLKKLEEVLDPINFFRINRKFIIHNEAIKEMYYTSKSRIRITLNPHFDEVIVVAIEKLGSFKRWLSE